nr:hypothetical protein [Tanacetum cinerariifolium]
DSDPEGLFSYVAQQLAPLNLAYLHLIEPRILGNIEDENADPTPVAAKLMRKHYKGVIIAAGGFNGESAEAIIQEGNADLVAFGRHFIANPDLPERLRHNLPLNAYDRPTFFGGTEVGYTDYEFYSEECSTLLCIAIRRAIPKMPASRPILHPQALRAGDAVALVSPAGPVAEARVEAAVRELTSWGLRPRVYPHALDNIGFLAGNDADRISDLNDALADPEIRAVLCNRGGYGVQRILGQLDYEAVLRDPKLVVG